MRITLTVDGEEGDTLATLLAALQTSAPPPDDGNGGTEPPPDINVYPLTMTPVVNPSDPVTLGVGPDSIIIVCSSNTPNLCNIALILDGRAIAGPLLVTGPYTASQTFTIRGSWGPPPHNLQFVSAGGSVGLGNFRLWSVTYDFIPGGRTGTSLDARGGPAVVGELSVWDNIGASFVMKFPADVPVPPPAPVGTPTITGATINGTVHAPATLAALVTATPAGGTLLLPAGTWSGSAAIGTACTIKGAGIQQTIINATGIALAQGKGVIVPTVAGVHVEDVTLSGAAVTDLNGAGIREAGPGIGYTATRVEFSGNQDGILSFASNITLTDCSFHDNGAGDGHSHEMYFNGSPTTTITLSSVVSVAGAGATHALKSRAGTTNVTGGNYTGNTDDGTVGGAVLNFPNCGTVSIDGAHLVLAAAAGGNTQFLTYGTENSANGAGTVTLTNVRITDQHTVSGGKFEVGPFGAGAHLVIGAGCVYDGTKVPQFTGWASVTGEFTQAA